MLARYCIGVNVLLLGVLHGLLIEAVNKSATSTKSTPLALVITPKHNQRQGYEDEMTFSFSFTVTNRGKNTFTIKDIVSSCACIDATLGKKDLNPGESTTFALIYDVRRYFGSLPILKVRVSVESNDRKRHSETVTIEGTRNPRVVTTPETIDFGRFELSLTKAVSISVLDHTSSLLVHEVASSLPYVRPKVKTIRKSESGRITGAEFTITFLDSAPYGSHNGYILFPLKNRETGHTIFFSGEFVAPIKVEPSNLFFGLIRKTETHKRSFSFSAQPNYHKKSFEWEVAGDLEKSIDLLPDAADSQKTHVVLNPHTFPSGYFKKTVRITVRGHPTDVEQRLTISGIIVD